MSRGNFCSLPYAKPYKIIYATSNLKGGKISFSHEKHGKQALPTDSEHHGGKIKCRRNHVVGEPDRFQSGKQVLKMGGLDLSADRSGKDSDKAIPEISKRGKADLRYALYQAALIASVKNREVRIYYTNKIRGREREKGIHTKMRVKLAAKLLVIAWTLMKKKEPFNPTYLKVE